MEPNVHVESIPLDRILCAPQVRSSFDETEVESLAQSIREVGLMQPIRVRRYDDSWVVIDGERRLRAAKLVGWDAMPAFVEEDELSEPEILQRQLIANCQRQDLSAIDKARAIARLMEQSECNGTQVSRMLGLSQGNVSRLLALLELPGDIQDQVGRGELSASKAYQIARAGDCELQKELAEEVAEKGLSRDALAGRLKAGRKPGTKLAKAAARCVARLAGGRSVTLAGSGLESVDNLIEWLEELLARARKARPRGMELSTFVALLRDEAKSVPGGET